MAFTPVEIRHVKLGRGSGATAGEQPTGCSRRSWTSFEEVWRERADLQDKLERLESDIARYRDLETLLRKTLVSAERSAQELKDQARREADVLLTRGARRGAADQAAGLRRAGAPARRGEPDQVAAALRPGDGR